MTKEELGATPAFPTASDRGMTYREWLVGMALQGVLSARDPELRPDQAAGHAAWYADEVLSLLAGQQGS